MREFKTLKFSNPEEGVLFINYSGSIMVTPKALVDEVKEDNEALENMLDEATEKINDLVAEKKNIAYSTSKTWLKEHRGDRKGSGDLAQALMIVDAVSGLKTRDMVKKRYPYNRNGSKKVYNERSIQTALAVKKPEDLQRIENLIAKYPEIFESVGADNVWQWVEKRRNKGAKK